MLPFRAARARWLNSTRRASPSPSSSSVRSVRSGSLPATTVRPVSGRSPNQALVVGPWVLFRSHRSILRAEGRPPFQCTPASVPASPSASFATRARPFSSTSRHLTAADAVADPDASLRAVGNLEGHQSLLEAKMVISPCFPPVHFKWMSSFTRAPAVSKRLVRRWLPKSATLHDVDVILREGSFLVEFGVPPDPDGKPDGVDAREWVLDEVNNALLRSASQSFFSLFRSPRARASFVYGTGPPGDLVARAPSQKLKVDVLPLPTPPSESAAPSAREHAHGTRLHPKQWQPSSPVTLEDELYLLLRPFGVMYNIQRRDPDALVPAGGLGGVTVEFGSYSSAVLAASALHGYTLLGGGSKPRCIRMEHIPLITTRKLTKALSDHPRIAALLAAILLATVTYFILDPIRRFFIKNRITKRFSIGDGYRPPVWSSGSRLAGWLSSSDSTDEKTSLRERSIQSLKNLRSALSLCSSLSTSSDAATPSVPGNKNQETLNGWLALDNTVPLLLSGPHGTGKSTIVSEAVANRPNVVIVDVRRMLGRTRDSALVHDFAEAMGFYPAFKGVHLANKLMDLLSQGTSSAAKDSSAGTDQADIGTVLDMTHQVLTEMALSRKCAAPDETTTKPLFVFTGFNEENAGKHDRLNLLPLLAEWSSDVSRRGYAQVVFVTNSSALWSSRSAADIDTLEVSDASEAAALQYVEAQLSSRGIDVRVDEGGLAASISVIGGRIETLDTFVRLVEAGLDYSAAVDHIVSKAELAIRRALLKPTNSSGSSKPDPLTWKVKQVWSIVEGFAKKPEGLPYHDTLFRKLGRDESIVQELNRLDVVRVVYELGFPTHLRPGSAVVAEACRRMVHDKELVKQVRAIITAQADAKLKRH